MEMECAGTLETEDAGTLKAEGAGVDVDGWSIITGRALLHWSSWHGLHNNEISLSS